MQSMFWNIWLERIRRTFEAYDVDMDALWLRVKFWAALWASVTLEFWDYPYPIIMRVLVAVVK